MSYNQIADHYFLRNHVNDNYNSKGIDNKPCNAQIKINQIINLSTVLYDCSHLKTSSYCEYYSNFVCSYMYISFLLM